MSTSVVFVGRVPAERGAMRRARRVSIGDFAAGRWRALPPRVAVFGDEALERLDPAPVGRLVRPTPTRLVGLHEATPIERVLEWHRVADVEFVSPSRLPLRIDALVAQPKRPVVELAAWAPSTSLHEQSHGPSHDASSDARHDVRRVLEALPRLDVPRVDAWARAVGLDRFRLARIVYRACGRSPKALCLAYLAACDAAGRRSGVAVAALAAAGGYSDAAAYNRALRARRRQGSSRDPG